MTDLSTIHTAGAIYTPSVPPVYAELVMKDPTTVRNGNLPSGITLDDLNFLNPNSNLFHISHVLYSAGQAMNNNKPCMIKSRNREHTTVIGDSGGYQIISGKLPWHGDPTRKKVLDWLETHCDIAITLDVPTASIDHPKSQFRSYDLCLKTTIESLRYFRQHRKNPGIKFLNVLQGRNRDEAEHWYNSVKHYPFDGWAFAGNTCRDFVSVLRRLIWMREAKRLENESWIHFLGTSQLEIACLLTTLQEALRRHVNQDITVSYDTSSPFLMGGKKSGYTSPNLSTKGFRMPSARMPVARRNVGSNTRFPFSGSIGDKLMVSDLCVRDETFQDSSWDGFAAMLVANHNLETLLISIHKAHRLHNLEASDAEEFCPVRLIQAREVIEEVFESETPFDVIDENFQVLEYFASRKGYHEEEQSR